MKNFCVQCGKEIVGRRAQAKFCSAECLHAFYRVSDNLPRTCKFCGKPFSKRNRKRKFCSDQCRDAFYRQKRKSQPLLKTCPVCGKEFPDKGHWGKCCGRKCRELLRRQEAQPKIELPRARGLDDWVREAAECNLDYGSYRALIERGKTFDELKAGAQNRTGVHAHRHNSILR